MGLEQGYKRSDYLFQFPKDLFKLNVTEEIAYEDNGLPEKVGRMLLHTRAKL